MTDTMRAVPKDDPLMIAWEAYKQTEDYANSLKWALLQERAEDVQGSLWAAFVKGYLAATKRTAQRCVEICEGFVDQETGEGSEPIRVIKERFGL